MGTKDSEVLEVTVSDKDNPSIITQVQVYTLTTLDECCAFLASGAAHLLVSAGQFVCM